MSVREKSRIRLSPSEYHRGTCGASAKVSVFPAVSTADCSSVDFYDCVGVFRGGREGEVRGSVRPSSSAHPILLHNCTLPPAHGPHPTPRRPACARYHQQ